MLWVEVSLQFAFLVLLLVGITLSPQDPFPVYLVVMDFACALVLAVQCYLHQHILCYHDHHYLHYLIAKLSSPWRTRSIVICAFGSAFLGALLYAVVPGIRGTLLGVSYVALGYVSRFYLFTHSIRQMLVRLQRMKPEYESFVMQLINTTVGLVCHWLSVSTLLHLLVYNIYKSEELTFNFFDTMYYICLCLINGPSNELIFDSTVARLVVIMLILALFLTLPGEFLKLSQAYQTLRRKRDKLDLLVHQFKIDRTGFACIVTGHLTLNSVMAMLSMPRSLPPVYMSPIHPVLLLDSQPLEPDLESFLKCQPWATIAHFCQYQVMSDLVLEQVGKLSDIVYILADYNVSLKDTVENVQRQDQRNIQLGRRFSQWNQRYRPSATPESVVMQVVLHESLELAREVCPQAEIVCLDDVFTSLFAHSTAAFGFGTLAMLCGTNLDELFMKKFYETVMSITSRNRNAWNGSIGQVISLFSLNVASFIMPEYRDMKGEGFQGYLRRCPPSTVVRYLGNRMHLGPMSITSTVTAALPVRATRRSQRISRYVFFPHFVLNPVLPELRQSGVVLLLHTCDRSSLHHFNLLPMAKKTSTDSASMVPISDNGPLTGIPNSVATQETTETARLSRKITELPESPVEKYIESLYQPMGMGYIDGEKDKISALPCKGHLVICDYLNQISRQVLPFIRQARVIHNQPQLRVVLITDCPLNKALRKQLKGLGQLDIVRGTPHHANSLRKANVAQARAVVAFHWVNDTQPEVPVTLDALSRRLREMNPRTPLIRFTSSFIFRQLDEALEDFNKDPKRRFPEYWGTLASGEGIYMDLGYYLLDNMFTYERLNTVLFPCEMPDSSYWVTLDLDQPPFNWSTSVSSDSSVMYNVMSLPTHAITCEKLVQKLQPYNIVFVGLRRMLEHSPRKWVSSVAFAPPDQLLLFANDQVILLVPRSLYLADLQIRL
ncbi:hypothetical protein IWQ62_001230 [Dispira parvispora]|uniref:RCK N-terminal domain-containing protein n=1 Tax=Dispira parvispora TaxID=1520584 RepID=A0A9W8AST4_9FUNG|nr:hypothetical protein IWQ62_001230 [Dispira parvispora]